MIQGYAEQPSPRPGGRIVLRVSTDAPRFRVEFHRLGAAARPAGASPWLPGRAAPPHLPYQDWGRPGRGLRGEALAPWAGYPFDVPAGWESGVYLATLVADDGGRGRALFVVRAPASGPRPPMLYKLPLFTYHAYNIAGGPPFDAATGRGQWCLYNDPRFERPPLPVPAGVSLHRPGGGAGARPYDAVNPDPFDPAPRQTFAHWDAKFVAWLERTGYAADYCTDADLHHDGDALLAPYRLLVSAGHDEYWSDAMRDAAEGHVARGGNAAFFGGNTCWWRVALHDPVTFSRTACWHETGRAENALTGVSFRNGGERDRDDFPVPVGFRVQHAGHWVYAGTGLRDGDVFGGGPGEYLVGYECDGAEFDRAELDAGRPVTPTGRDGTPPGFTILGVGDTRPSGPWGLGNGAATMGVLRRGGTVFTAATTDWPRLLTSAATPQVAAITRNVLDRLSACG